MPLDPAQHAVDLAKSQGFAAAGVCALDPLERAEFLRDWLAAGKHGSMGYLAEHAELRVDPVQILPGARSAIMVADLYADRAGNQDPPLPPGRGRVARYARGRDYHKLVKKRLHALADALQAEFPDARFRAFVDTAPVPERPLAARAGLGWIGKNTLLIHPRIGSYWLLGGVLTTLELEPPPEQRPVADHCGGCTRCIDACPTGAITPYSVDARRCISYLTIERRPPIDPEFHAPIGDWLYGCDVCQQVCPYNAPRDPAWTARHSPPPHEQYAPRRDPPDSFDLLNVLGWNEDDRREAFTASAMKRATLDMMKRNALIVAGNQLARGEDLPELRGRIEEIANAPDEPEMVRDTARSVLRRVG